MLNQVQHDTGGAVLIIGQRGEGSLHVSRDDLPRSQSVIKLYTVEVTIEEPAWVLTLK